MEPSPETYQKIGALCAAWSYLEAQTERTLLGVLKIDATMSRVLVWKMGMRERWQILIKEGKCVLDDTKYQTLSAIDDIVRISMRDRNIIVHGLVNAIVKEGTILPSQVIERKEFNRIPCWTSYMGEGKGKNFPISTEAVATVFANIQKAGSLLRTLNHECGFNERTNPTDTIEADWPKYL